MAALAVMTNWFSPAHRLGGLRRFAPVVTILIILGHTWFGFEQSFLQPLVAVLTGYTVEFLLEFVRCRSTGETPRYRGGMVNTIDFFLSAHITSLVLSMLLYTNEQLLPLMFAVSIAMGSKYIFRLPAGRGSRHFLNPSNLAMSCTLLLFPWVGIAPPYHFTENLTGIGNWILPAIIVCSGTYLNWRYTKRLPALLAWVGLFAAQALVRHLVFDAPLLAMLTPMTGMAFMLFTFYMVTDPPTTPTSVRGQIMFGGAVAVGYGILLTMHVVFGFFFSLTAVCLLRGIFLYARMLVVRSPSAESPLDIGASVQGAPAVLSGKSEP